MVFGYTCLLDWWNTRSYSVPFGGWILRWRLYDWYVGLYFLLELMKIPMCLINITFLSLVTGQTLAENTKGFLPLSNGQV